MVEIRRSYDRLISTMGFPILVRWHLYIESGPWKTVVSNVFLLVSHLLYKEVPSQHGHDPEVRTLEHDVHNPHGAPCGRAQLLQRGKHHGDVSCWLMVGYQHGLLLQNTRHILAHQHNCKQGNIIVQNEIKYIMGTSPVDWWLAINTASSSRIPDMSSPTNTTATRKYHCTKWN